MSCDKYLAHTDFDCVDLNSAGSQMVPDAIGMDLYSCDIHVDFRTKHFFEIQKNRKPCRLVATLVP